MNFKENHTGGSSDTYYFSKIGDFDIESIILQMKLKVKMMMRLPVRAKRQLRMISLRQAHLIVGMIGEVETESRILRGKRSVKLKD